MLTFYADFICDRLLQILTPIVDRLWNYRSEARASLILAVETRRRNTRKIPGIKFNLWPIMLYRHVGSKLRPRFGSASDFNLFPFVDIVISQLDRLFRFHYRSVSGAGMGWKRKRLPDEEVGGWTLRCSARIGKGIIHEISLTTCNKMYKKREKKVMCQTSWLDPRLYNGRIEQRRYWKKTVENRQFILWQWLVNKKKNPIVW